MVKLCCVPERLRREIDKWDPPIPWDPADLYSDGLPLLDNPKPSEPEPRKKPKPKPKVLTIGRKVS